ncbi:MAG: FtsW/RodA/SpoVE family cell cycle protein [Patescibacteria group bacterium]|nr:FtsW/RodA/SpoVE family cell cycle protein [Patescibacteria group bacterium]
MLWRTDWILFGSLLALTVFGLLMVYSIGASNDVGSLLQFKKQIIAVLIGGLAMVLLAILDYRQLKSLGMVVYAGGMALLVSVLLFGSTVRGTQGWFKIGSLSLQPVELAKVAFAVFLASYFARHVYKKLNWVTFFGSLFAMLGYVAPILMQPDFGSAMVIVAMWLIGVAFAGLRWKAWILLIIIGSLGSFMVWHYAFKPYQKDRLLAFINPQMDPLGAGYNVRQAQTAIGSGGILGKGVGQGSQSRLRFLPEASTDFMFAVMGEELGFVGLTVVLGLFGVLLIRILFIGRRSEDPFVGIYCGMITGMIGLHVLINAGMNLGVMPVTGIPLPFSSAAASSLVAGYVALGVVQSAAVYSKNI